MANRKNKMWDFPETQLHPSCISCCQQLEHAFYCTYSEMDIQIFQYEKNVTDYSVNCKLTNVFSCRGKKITFSPLGMQYNVINEF